MHVSSFANNTGDDTLHSNEYTAGSVSAQSFSQRKQIEQSRKIIGGYHQSAIGSAYVQRDQLSQPAPRRPNIGNSSRGMTRQQTNARPGSLPSRQVFRNPPAREYNPYG